MLLKIIINPSEPSAGLYLQPDRNSTRIARVRDGETVEINDLERQESDNPLLSQSWLKVEYRLGTAAKSGWFERKYIDFEAPIEHTPEPFDEAMEEVFIRECARNEFISREAVAINGEAENGPTILADFLIALARFESKLSNMSTQLAGTDAIGPFQINKDEWNVWMESPAGSGATEEDRFRIVPQIRAAEFLIQQDWLKLIKLARQDIATEGDNLSDEYVPSFLNLLHARLMGPVAAIAVNAANAYPVTKNDDLANVLAQVLSATELEALMERRGRILSSKASAAKLSVNGFFLTTSEILAEHLTRAFTLLNTHAADFVTSPSVTASSWMDTAETELAMWKSADVTETSPKGRARIVDHYFLATDLAVDNVAPWCGAFAAWCLANCNNATAAASVFPGAARAANWKTWGTSEIRLGGIKKLTDVQLRGAVVVLHPGEGTGSSGHVCFAVGRPTKADHIECIGGNQSDTVRKSTYPISRIAAIRVLEESETAALEEGEITPKTVDLIKQFEGLKLDSYRDSVGVWTIGYGTTSRASIGVNVGPGMTIDQATAEDFLRRGLEKFAGEIKPAIKRVHNSNQFGAMLSLAYNVGSGGFKGSTCLRKFNAGDLAGAADAILMWNKAGGKIVPGLVNRREKEREYFRGN